MLAKEHKVSASSHNQALSALLFLYREVLAIDLPWLNNIGRPLQTKRIPSVLTKDEVAGLLAQMDGVTARLTRCRLTCTVAWSAATTCLKSACNAP
jgi:site-specific recombinase XerD